MSTKSAFKSLLLLALLAQMLTFQTATYGSGFPTGGIIVGGYTTQSKCVEILSGSPFGLIDLAVGKSSSFNTGIATGQTTLKLLQTQVVAGENVVVIFKNGENYLGIRAYIPLGSSAVPQITNQAVNNLLATVLSTLEVPANTQLNLSCEESQIQSGGGSGSGSSGSGFGTVGSVGGGSPSPLPTPNWNKNVFANENRPIYTSNGYPITSAPLLGYNPGLLFQNGFLVGFGKQINNNNPIRPLALARPSKLIPSVYNTFNSHSIGNQRRDPVSVWNQLFSSAPNDNAQLIKFETPSSNSQFGLALNKDQLSKDDIAHM